jgi:O-antigen/teichoic acid export membrane protein
LAWQVRRFGLAFDREVLRSMLRYSAPMVLAGLCQFALHSADRFLFGAFSTLDELGGYGIGYKLGYAVTGVLLSAFLLIWYPYVFAVKVDEERREMLGRAAVLVPAALFAASLPVALFAPEIVRALADPKFHEAWRIVPIVAFAYLFWGLFQVLQTPIYVAGRTGELPRFVALAALANIAANAVLLPPLGGLGAALATVFSLAALSWLARRAANRIERFAVDWRRLAILLAPSAACAFALYGGADGPIAPALRAALFVVIATWMVLGWSTRAERSEALAAWSGLLRKRAG